MNDAKFKIAIENSVQILKSLKLYKSRGVKPIGDHSEESKNIAKSNKHSDIYNSAIQQQDYEILLTDDSIFQFSSSNSILRFSFIQNPNIYVSKQEFLISLYGKEDLSEFNQDELEKLEGEINEDEYEQFLAEQEFNLEANIIRYDLDHKGYAPLIHSYSHIHIGLNQNLRIPCNKILTPDKFTIFSVKNSYYNEWKKGFDTIPKLDQEILASKNRCDNLPVNYWANNELNELYLT